MTTDIHHTLASTRFHRSRSNSMIGGVCGGIAQDLRIDPNLLRVIAVLGLVASAGLAAAAYVACWALLPEVD